MKKTPEGAERGADPVPRALTTISVLLTIGTAADPLSHDPLSHDRPV